jgi:hypothetical protein
MFKSAVNVILLFFCSVVTVPIFRPLRGGVIPGRSSAAWDARRKHGMCPVSSELSVVSMHLHACVLCVSRAEPAGAFLSSLKSFFFFAPIQKLLANKTQLVFSFFAYRLNSRPPAPP